MFLWNMFCEVKGLVRQIVKHIVLVQLHTMENVYLDKLDKDLKSMHKLKGMFTKHYVDSVLSKVCQ